VQISVTSSEQIQIHRFTWLATVALPLLALFFQAYIPIYLHFLTILDLPLLVVIFFAVARRSPISGVLTGAIVGLVQDSLTHRYLGLYGISKTVVGYLASSLGVRVDVENPGSRFLMGFVFYFVHQTVYQFVAHGLAAEALQLRWGHWLLAGLINALVAVPLFGFLDRSKGGI
jgi:rod shape-determining protein MreD